MGQGRQVRRHQGGLIWSCDGLEIFILPRYRGGGRQSTPILAPRFFASRELSGQPCFFSLLPACAIPGFRCAQPRHQTKGEAERRETRRQTRAAQTRGAPCGVRSPLGVPLRLSPGRQLVPKALHQAMLRETVRGVQSCTAAPTGERRPCASPRVLPAPEKRTYCLRTASTSRAGRCAGRMMPDAARERVTSPPAGTALAPSQGVSSRRTSLRKARWGLLVRRAGWIQEIPAGRFIPLIRC